MAAHEPSSTATCGSTTYGEPERDPPRLLLERLRRPHGLRGRRHRSRARGPRVPLRHRRQRRGRARRGSSAGPTASRGLSWPSRSSTGSRSPTADAYDFFWQYWSPRRRGRSRSITGSARHSPRGRRGDPDDAAHRGAGPARPSPSPSSTSRRSSCAGSRPPWCASRTRTGRSAPEPPPLEGRSHPRVVRALRIERRLPATPRRRWPSAPVG